MWCEMAALNSKALQEQISAIMGALTKAAVAEICELVDQGYSLLQMEIRRSRRENQDLKKKLHLIESIVVRGGSAAAGTPVPGEPQQQPDTELGAPAAEAGGAEELPEVVLIKDEDSENEHTVDEDGGKGSEGAAAAASEDITLLPVRRRRAGGHAGDRKSVSDHPALKVCKVTVGTQKKSLSGSGLDSPGEEPVLSSQHAAGEEAVCCFGPGASDLLREGQQVLSSAAEQGSYFNDGCLMESEPNRPELDFGLMWDKQAKGQLALAHFLPPQSPDADGFAMKLVSVAGSVSTDSQLSESSSSGFEYENVDGASFHPHRDPPGPPPLGGGGRGKRFLCSICNRTYATSQNLEVHMRIHTGERPFSCEQCGKKFTQSAHLKSHASVHSGERPYPCKVCSRSFIVRYSLKLHMKKCHPNVPNE